MNAWRRRTHTLPLCPLDNPASTGKVWISAVFHRQKRVSTLILAVMLLHLPDKNTGTYLPVGSHRLCSHALFLSDGIFRGDRPKENGAASGPGPVSHAGFGGGPHSSRRKGEDALAGSTTGGVAGAIRTAFYKQRRKECFWKSAKRPEILKLIGHLSTRVDLRLR